MIPGLFTIAAALIGLSAVFFNLHKNKDEKAAAQNVSITENNYLNRDTSLLEKTAVPPGPERESRQKTKVYDPGVIHLLIIDAGSGLVVDGVKYLINGITGESDQRGLIEIQVARLRPKTDQDMFEIHLSKDGYRPKSYYMGITENQTLSLPK